MHKLMSRNDDKNNEWQPERHFRWQNNDTSREKKHDFGDVTSRHLKPSEPADDGRQQWKIAAVLFRVKAPTASTTSFTWLDGNDLRKRIRFSSVKQYNLRAFDLMERTWMLSSPWLYIWHHISLYFCRQFLNCFPFDVDFCVIHEKSFAFVITKSQSEAMANTNTCVARKTHSAARKFSFCYQRTKEHWGVGSTATQTNFDWKKGERKKRRSSEATMIWNLDALFSFIFCDWHLKSMRHTFLRFHFDQFYLFRCRRTHFLTQSLLVVDDCVVVESINDVVGRLLSSRFIAFRAHERVCVCDFEFTRTEEVEKAS